MKQCIYCQTIQVPPTLFKECCECGSELKDICDKLPFEINSQKR